MFQNEYSEYSKKEIEMKEIDAIALENLINFAYSGSIRINTSNCQSIMIGASFLQLVKVCDACAMFLKKKWVIVVQHININWLIVRAHLLTKINNTHFHQISSPERPRHSQLCRLPRSRTARRFSRQIHQLRVHEHFTLGRVPTIAMSRSHRHHQTRRAQLHQRGGRVWCGNALG